MENRLHRRERLLLGVAMILLAMNLRPAAAAVGPLLHRIRIDTGLSGLGGGLLAALPVFCFGAVAPLIPMLGQPWPGRRSQSATSCCRSWSGETSASAPAS